MASVLQRIKTRFYYWRFDLRCIALDQILPHQTDLILNLRNWSKDLRAGSILDSIVLASVARCFQPTVCVEIGTGDGRSATIVAANTPPNAMIYTLDSEFPNDPVKGCIPRPARSGENPAIWRLFHVLRLQPLVRNHRLRLRRWQP